MCSVSEKSPDPCRADSLTLSGHYFVSLSGGMGLLRAALHLQRALLVDMWCLQALADCRSQPICMCSCHESQTRFQLFNFLLGAAMAFLSAPDSKGVKHLYSPFRLHVSAARS